MGAIRARPDLVEVGDDVWAYLQPDGSWGLSNAGLVGAAGTSLLVDTLFDLELTAAMLATMRRTAPAAAHIGTVVNTHANGDHCYGNALLEGTEIVASRRAAEEMREVPPRRMALLARVVRLARRFAAPRRALARALAGVGLGDGAALVEAAPYLDDIFGAFAFDGIELTLPTRTFDGELELDVAGRTVRLLEVGPAHTEGDVLVHVPDAGVLFAGDILFSEGHPIVWAGPVSRWIAICERILAMDVAAVVPGHGPLAGKDGVRALERYLRHVDREARLRHAAGMDALEAALDISLDGFAAWRDAERLVVNVDAVYRELEGRGPRRSVIPCFAAMARYAARTGCRTQAGSRGPIR